MESPGLEGQVLCGSHQEGAADLAEKLLCPDSVACGQFALTSPVRTPGQRGCEAVSQDLPESRVSPAAACSLFASDLFLWEEDISNLLNTVTKQLLVYSHLVGGRDGEWRIGVSDPGLKGLPAPLPCLLAAGGRDHCILGAERTTEVTPPGPMCSPEVTVQLRAAGPPPLPPWTCSLRPLCWEVGSSCPASSWPPLHACLPPPVSLSKTAPSAPSLGSSAWLCPGHPGPLAPHPSLPGRPPRLGEEQTEHCHGASQCEELLSLWWGDCGLFARVTLPPTPGSVCSKYNGEVGRTLKRGVGSCSGCARRGERHGGQLFPRE